MRNDVFIRNGTYKKMGVGGQRLDSFFTRDHSTAHTHTYPALQARRVHHGTHLPASDHDQAEKQTDCRNGAQQHLQVYPTGRVKRINKTNHT